MSVQIPFEKIEKLPSIEPIPNNFVTFQNGDGPTLIIMGGMHGNEINGVTVVTQLFEYFKDHQGELSGTLHLVIANPYASAVELRGRDLNGKILNANRMFATEEYVKEEWKQEPEYRRIRNIIKLYASAPKDAIMIDLHSLRWASDNDFVNDGFLISRGAEKHKDIGRWMNVPRHVHTPTTFLAPDGSSFASDLAFDFIESKDDESTMTRCGFTLETGFAGNADNVEKTYKSMLNLMRGINMLDGEAELFEQEQILVTEEINAKAPFTWNTEIFPVKTADILPPKTLLGVYDNGEEVYSPDEETIAIFPNEHIHENHPGVELIKFGRKLRLDK